MSFDALLKSDVKKKTKAIEIQVGDQKLSFTAHEVGTFRQAEIAAEGKVAGKVSILPLVVESIVDQEGKRMTLEQADALPNKYQKIFIEAVVEVNGFGEDETEKN